VVNRSFYASGSQDPLLARRGKRELPYIKEVRDQHAVRVALIPWKAEDPVGPVALLGLLHTNARQEPAVIP
ncbi:MAG: arsenical pump-driving ATPase, partial [bacterium]